MPDTKLTALSFDLYNTILEIETDEYSIETFQVFSEYLKEKNILLDAEKLKNDFIKIINDEINKLSDDRELNIEKVFRKLFVENKISITNNLYGEIIYKFRVASRKRIKLKPEIRDLLQNLKKRYKLYLVSDAQRYFTYPEIKMFGLDKIFDMIILSQELGFRKKSGKPFQRLLEKTGLKNTEVIHIGDDINSDGAGAEKAGIKYFILNYNLSSLLDIENII